VSFGEFYSHGGVLMHLITLWFVAAGVILSVHIGKKAGAHGDMRFLDIADRCIFAGACVGVMASALNATEWLGALSQIDDLPKHLKGIIRACMPTFYPVTFGMMLAATMTMATVVLRLRVRHPVAAEPAQPS
jgi:hypothetical protein